MQLMKCLSMLAMSFVLFGGATYAAYSIQPSLLIGEQYNDNIFLQPTSPERDFITEVTPAITSHYQSPFWTWDGNASLQYLYFNKYHDESRSNPAAYVRNLTDLWSTVLYFEGIDDFRRVSTNVVTNYTTQSYIVNQSNQNTVTLHPYIDVKPLQNTTWETGYKFIDTHYSSGIGFDRIDNTVYFTSSSKLSSRLTFTVGADLTKEQNDVNDYKETDVYTGLGYLYAENSSIYGMVTKSWIDYETSPNQNYYGWNAGVSHHLAEYTIKLESGSTPIPDPSHIGTREEYYRATITRATARSTISVGGASQEYKNGQINQTTSTSKSLQGELSYRFTPRLSGTATSYYQDTHDVASESYIYLSQSSLRFDYNLTQKIIMSLAYTYIISYAPVLIVDNYRNNQALIEFKILF